MRITLYHDPDEPKPVVLRPALEAEEAGRYSRKVKYHRDPWALAAHWRLTWPVREYLRGLAKHLRHLDDFTFELADGTTLTGDEAKAYVRRYA